MVAGEAGVGKSRLATEVAERALRLGVTVLTGHTSSVELALPYLPFVEAIGNHLAKVDVKTIRTRMGAAAAELATLFPRLGRAATSALDDPSQSKLRLFEAVLQLLEYIAHPSGIVIVLEDLHWADASTRELLDYITRRLGRARILVLGTYRQDETHRRHPLRPLIQSWRRSGADVIPLRPLQPEGIAKMIEAIFDEPTSSDTRDFLHERCEGNPFVLEEILKDALERGDIFRTGRGWQRREVADFRIPETVAEAILARVERLQPHEVDVLQAAAVLGATFTEATLHELTGAGEEVVQAALQAGIRQQLLAEGNHSVGHFRFRHALTRQAIYDDLIATQRQRLHSRAADALAKERGARRVDRVHHLFEANRQKDAVPIALKAAAEANRAHAYLDAAKLFERALPFVHGNKRRGLLLCRLGTANWLGGQPAAAAAHLADGVDLLAAAGYVREAARHRLTLGRCYWEHREVERAYDTWQRARQSLEPLGASEELSLAYMRLGSMNIFNLRFDKAKDWAELGIRTAVAAKSDLARLWNQCALAVALSGLGDTDRGLALADRTAAEAMELGHYYIAWMAATGSTQLRSGSLRGAENDATFEFLRKVPGVPGYVLKYYQGESLMFLGRVRDAEACLRVAAVEARVAGNVWFENASEWGLAWMLAALDRLPEARELVQKHSHGLERQDIEGWGHARMRVAIDSEDIEFGLPEAVDVPDLSVPERRLRLDLAVELQLAAGRVDDARRLATLTEGEAYPYERPWQLRLEGRVALAAGNVALAMDRLSAAAAIWEGAKYLLEESRARRSLALVYAAAGDRSAAQQQLQRVMSIADTTGAAFEARKASEQLARLGFDVELVGAGPAEAPTATGERLVTIMFVDVRGYSKLTGHIPPADLHDRISSFHRWAAQEVHRHRGVVDKFQGDAIMATFNISGMRVGHSDDAVSAAIAIRDRAAYLALHVGVGIASGPAIVGALVEGANLSVLGEATNLASRLQARAAAGEILLSDETYRRLRQPVSARSERLRLKGFKTLIKAYRLSRA